MKIILLAGWGLLFTGVLAANEQVGVHPADADPKIDVVKPVDKVTNPKESVGIKRIVPATSVNDMAAGRPQSSAVIPPRGAARTELDSMGTNDGLPDWGDGMTVGGVLIFAVGLALWLKLRKRGGYLPKGGRLMRLISSLDIPGGRVTMIEVGETLYLVGCNEGGGVACLDRINDPGTRAQWLSDSEVMRVANGESDSSFQDEYADMIGRMSTGTARTQEPVPEGTAGRIHDELDGLKQRLRDLA